MKLSLSSNHRARYNKTKDIQASPHPDPKTWKILLNSSFPGICLPSFQCFVFLLNWMRCNSSANGARLTADTDCMDTPEILHFTELSESLPWAESFSSLYFRPLSMYAQTWSSGHWDPEHKSLCRFRGPESKCFPFCFLPLPRLPTVLHYFWPLVSVSCFVRKSPDTAKKCSQFKWVSGEKARDRQEHKETVQ